MELEELYQEIIIDHAKHPRHSGSLEGADASASLLNPLCGDEVEVFLKVDGGRVAELRFEGHGCSISQASASMMTELCQGKSFEELHEFFKLFLAMMKNEESGEKLEVLGDAKCLEGVKKFSARIKCATLGWEALEQCLKKLEESSR